MEFYTYIWRDANGVPFYVGKGKGRRAKDTAATRRSEEFRGIHAAGGCTVEIVDMFIHESQAHAHEVELIARYGRREHGGLLINKTDGGEGMSGASLSEESRAKISAARTGMVFSEEHRENIGASQRGHKRWLGKKHNPSTIARFRIIHGSRSQETRANMSAAQIGKKHSAEQKEKIGKASRMAPPRSGFKGVCFDKAKSKWMAKIKVDGKTVNLGRFKEEASAAVRYDAEAIKVWGVGNCYLNFPTSVCEDAAA
jgi:hypothetical protein